jgi:branched-chain amino acid transport system permease protein
VTEPAGPSVPTAAAEAAGAAPRGARPVLLGAAAAAALAFPPLAGFEDYLLFNACVALVYLLLATGYNVLIGMCGQLSMAHVAFFGLGAYASALLTRDLGAPWPLAFLAAVALPTASAWVMARAAVRFVGPYLAMITFAFHAMALTLFINWTEVTNGWGGLSRIPPVRLGTLAVNTPVRSYYLLLAWSAAALYVAYRIKRSRLGRAFFAIRENRLAAKGVGVDTARAITLAFCLSGAFAGAAGSLHAHLVRYIDPTSFGLQKLIDLLIILIVGGRGSVAGVAVTAIAFVFALEYLRFLQEWKLVIFGALLILLVNASPDGLADLVRRAAGRRARPEPA